MCNVPSEGTNCVFTASASDLAWRVRPVASRKPSGANPNVRLRQPKTRSGYPKHRSPAPKTRCGHPKHRSPAANTRSGYPVHWSPTPNHRSPTPNTRSRDANARSGDANTSISYTEGCGHSAPVDAVSAKFQKFSNLGSSAARPEGMRRRIVGGETGGRGILGVKWPSVRELRMSRS